MEGAPLQVKLLGSGNNMRAALHVAFSRLRTIRCIWQCASIADRSQNIIRRCRVGESQQSRSIDHNTKTLFIIYYT